jgi:hypothetical protein
MFRITVHIYPRGGLTSIQRYREEVIIEVVGGTVDMAIRLFVKPTNESYGPWNMQ